MIPNVLKFTSKCLMKKGFRVKITVRETKEIIFLRVSTDLFSIVTFSIGSKITLDNHKLNTSIDQKLYPRIQQTLEK